MTNKKLSREEKKEEVLHYRGLVQATLDYHLDKGLLSINSAVQDEQLKLQAEHHIMKGGLTTLQLQFRDQAEMQTLAVIKNNRIE